MIRDGRESCREWRGAGGGYRFSYAAALTQHTEKTLHTEKIELKQDERTKNATK